MSNLAGNKGNPADVCPICGGLGLVTRDVPVGHPDFGKAFPCVCQAEIVKARDATRLRRMGNLDAYVTKTFSSFEVDFTLIEAEEVFPRDAFKEMGELRRRALGFEHRQRIKVAAEIAYRYAKNPSGWLLFEGRYGAGKTHLAAAIANYWLERGEPVLFMTTPDLLDHLKSTFGPSSEVAYDELFERIRKAPLLILDDLGAESQTSWAIEKLYQLINDRHRFELPTVITTNRDPAQIEPRIRSRLFDQQLTHILKLEVPDWRGPAMAWQDTDLTSLERYTNMTFDTFEPRLSEGLKEEDVRRLGGTIQLAREFIANPEGWFVLTGAHGCGKTHLAAAMAHEWRRNGRGTPALFVTVADLLSYLRATFRPDSPIGYDRRMEEIKRADLLILDDLSIDERGMSSWAREKLYDILIYRFDYEKPTVITTAQALHEMDVRLRSRVANSAHSMVEAITVPYYPGKPSRRRAAPPRRTR